MGKNSGWFAGFVALAGCLVFGLAYTHPHALLGSWSKSGPSSIPEFTANEPELDAEESSDPDANPGYQSLGEEAVALEFHKRLPLPFNAMAASVTKSQTDQEEEERLFNGPKQNRLPGTITFQEETQELPAATADSLNPPSVPNSELAMPLAETESGDSRIMPYCEEEEDESAKKTMPYAEEDTDENRHLPPERVHGGIQ